MAQQPEKGKSGQRDRPKTGTALIDALLFDIDQVLKEMAIEKGGEK